MNKYKLKRKTLIAFILIMITFSSSFLLAKYASLISGMDSKKVAKWSVSCDECDPEHPKELNLVTGDDDTFSENYVFPSYTLKVKSISEVSASYKIILRNIPNTMQVQIDDGDYQPVANNIITFENVNYKINMDDNDKERIHTLTFKVPLDLDIDDVNNIDVELKFDQID